MRALLLLFLTSCFTAPDLGHVYECTGVFICYGDHFGVLGSACANDAAEAEALAYEYLLPQIEEAKCGDDWELSMTCTSTGNRCLAKD